MAEDFDVEAMLEAPFKKDVSVNFNEILCNNGWYVYVFWFMCAVLDENDEVE